MAKNQQYNPIRSINGLPIKCPSSYVWKLEDVASPGAGRTEDLSMDIMRIGQVVGIELSWINLTIQEMANLLKAFNPEYITVEYLDAMVGNYVRAEFYVGSRNAPLYNSTSGLWSGISFSITKRSGV